MRLKCPKCNYYIDDELVPLIIELNRVGLKTKYCCSGHKGSYAYIQIVGDSVKGIGYGYLTERYDNKGKMCLIRWKIPKYPKKTIRCSDCGTILEIEEE